MSNRNIYITVEDQRHLQHLLASEFTRAIGPSEYLNDLQSELQRAIVVESSEIPADVVTMNSKVRLCDLASGEMDTYTLVYPASANIAENWLSILAPIGTAILGYRVGDVVRWRVPDGTRRLRVEAVLFQPEREATMQLGSLAAPLTPMESPS